MKKLRTVFFGNTTFALPLVQILAEKTDLLAIITSPDRRIVKRNTVKFVHPELKTFALEKNIPCFQPQSLLEDLHSEISLLASTDIGFVCAYAKIIPEAIFNLPKMGLYNFHTSLLPKYRGASPIQSALLNGDSSSGLSIQKIEASLDTGDLIWEKPVEISPLDTFSVLEAKLSTLSIEGLEDILQHLESQGELPPSHPQEGEISFCKKIRKEDGLISFQEHSAKQIWNRFRAFERWPKISFLFRDKPCQILQMQNLEKAHSTSAGSILNIGDSFIDVACQEGTVRLLTLQMQNKNPISGKAFYHGYQLTKNIYDSQK